MKVYFANTKNGTLAYIRKSVRINGKSTTVPVKKLGLLSEIQKETGCADPRQWVIDMAQKMTEEEKAGSLPVEISFKSNQEIELGERPLRFGGDLLLASLYNRLGLPDICKQILKSSRAKYDLNRILEVLVMGRILFPSSKSGTFELAKSLVYPPSFAEEEMFRALSLLSAHSETIQAQVYKHSQHVVKRRQRVIYYDCTNYYFEIENNDKDYIDQETGEIITGLRKRGKSKEGRPNPIVQMGMFMDMDGIPLAYTIFPGNESEQTSLQPLEEILNRRFDMTDYVVSTDAGLASESNRRYNMAEGRDYICVQSIPSLRSADRDMVVAPEGWRISYCKSDEYRKELEDRFSKDGIFNLSTLRKGLEDCPDLLKNVTLYKEIIVEKEQKIENPAWLSAQKTSPDTKPVDAQGKAIPHYNKSTRKERTIVTYSHDYALYLAHKRNERIAIANKIVKNKQTKSRTSQQSPLNYVEQVHKTDDGQTAVKVEMHIKQDVIDQEERFDGFYAYGTSLEDHALTVLKARSFHHEIEHLFRTTKTFLDARPVYLQRQDRIKTHFLICFLAMVILKILQRQITEANQGTYAKDPLTMDALIGTLRDYKFGTLPGANYQPMFIRTTLTDQLQELVGINANTQIISSQKMKTMYRKVNKG